MADTAVLLEAMTDPGKFELLVTDVLRVRDPVYATLVHTGVNADGKPIACPIDGIGIAHGSQPPHFVMAQHTTVAETKLRGKWLGPDGDLRKAEQCFEIERERTPDARLTLILSTNRIPGQRLFRDVHSRARSAGIDLDVWDRSRLAHFLDHLPDGQWLRSFHFGVAQQRLSRDLLADISRNSANALLANLLDEPKAWIERSLDAIGKARALSGEPLTYFVMESGMGKTTVAARLLSTWISEGGLGLWIPAQIAQASLTIEEAIDSVMRRFCPELELSAATRITELPVQNRPFLLVVDDINRSDNPAALAERILLWSRISQNSLSRSCGPVHIICPIWPQVLDSMPEAQRRAIETYAIFGGKFTREEGVKATLRRAALCGKSISEIQASELSQALGDDPLLIALSSGDPAGGDSPTKAIPSFIRDQLVQCAVKSSRGYLASDYHRALGLIASSMLDHRDLLPNWNAIVNWFTEDSEVLFLLRELINQRSVCHLEDDIKKETFVFRHDRVRAFFLAATLAKRMQTNESLELSIEPFYAEAFGQALVMIGCPETWTRELMTANPLSLFFAFKQLVQAKSDRERAVVQAIFDWLGTAHAKSSSTATARHAMQAVLAGIDAPVVRDMIPLFQELSWNTDFASFRNGDMVRGAAICASLDPGTQSSFRDALIRHVLANQCTTALNTLKAQLIDPSLSPRIRIGTLYLAGFVANAALHGSIESCWTQYGHLSEYFAAFLWAACECAGDDSEVLLSLICDRWASLPEPEQDHTNTPHRSTPYDYGLQFGFQRQAPTAAIPFLLHRAEQEDLRWDITLLLEHVDQPDVAVFMAKERGRIARSVNESGRFSPWLSSPFERRQDLPLSPASRGRLYDMWTDTNLDEFVRDRALELWTKGAKLPEIVGLSTLSLTERLSNRLLLLRIRLKDNSAVPELREKIRTAQDRIYWWQFARGYFCDEFVDLIEEEFELRKAKIQPSWEKAWYSTDAMVSEVVMQLTPASAEVILGQHWEHLQYNPSFVHSALFIATGVTSALAAEAIARCPQPRELLKHLSYHWKFGGTEERERLTPARLIAIEPYLNLLDDRNIHDLWIACNVHGFFEWRRLHVDRRLSDEWRTRNGLDDQDLFAKLDEFSNSSKEPWIEHWLEQFDERGDPISRPLDIVKRWLASRNSTQSLRIAARVLALRGSRDDLDILNVSVAGGEADNIRHDARFAVFRRTLN